MNWTDKRILVTGGASFIGSHLTEKLIELGAKVRVADNFSSGEKFHVESLDCEILEGDLLDPDFCRASTRSIEVVFHLAADHGGRGYIDAHQVECSTNMILDGQVFRAAYRNGIPKIVFASSGCVYPHLLKWMSARKSSCTKTWLPRPTKPTTSMVGLN